MQVLVAEWRKAGNVCSLDYNTFRSGGQPNTVEAGIRTVEMCAVPLPGKTLE